MRLSHWEVVWDNDFDWVTAREYTSEDYSIHIWFLSISDSFTIQLELRIGLLKLQ